eukprot:SAG11_NODE_193_length_12862_cov_7.128888_8_plen_73_part_00
MKHSSCPKEVGSTTAEGSAQQAVSVRPTPSDETAIGSVWRYKLLMKSSSPPANPPSSPAEATWQVRKRIRSI